MVLKRVNNIGFLLILIFPVLVKCSSASNSSTSISLDSNEINMILDKNGNKIALLSCLRCGCFVDSYNRKYKESGRKPEEYVLLADTVCNKFLFPVNHLASVDIEKISDEIYNLTLIKRKDQIVSVKILEVEDSKKMDKVIADFFKK